jgi:hypothetical protein
MPVRTTADNAAPRGLYPYPATVAAPNCSPAGQFATDVEVTSRVAMSAIMVSVCFLVIAGRFVFRLGPPGSKPCRP